MSNFFKKLALTSVLLAAAASASAVTITFDGVSNNTYDNTTIVREGFVFGNVAGDEQHFHEIDTAAYGLVSNGTSSLLVDRDTRLFTERDGGGLFSASSIDVAGSRGNLGSEIGIDILAYLNNILVGTITVGFDSDTPFQTVNLSSFGNIDRLVFDGISGGFSLDNAVFNDASSNVPEPGSVALLGLAFAAFAANRRRKAGK